MSYLRSLDRAHPRVGSGRYERLCRMESAMKATVEIKVYEKDNDVETDDRLIDRRFNGRL